jgi:zinc protease
VLTELLYPEGHPYHWPVVGYMDDLTAASYDDVVQFFRTYYAPGNASLVLAGDLDPVQARALVEKWFGDVKAGAPVVPITIPGVMLTDVKKQTITDVRCHVSTWRGSPRSGPGTPRWTWSATCSLAARTRASSSASSTTCRLRRT